MLPDGPSEMEQLDALTVELGEAGRIARVSTAQRGRPDPVFTMRLRSELLASFGSIPMLAPGDADLPSLIEPMPRPLDAAAPEIGAGNADGEVLADFIPAPVDAEEPLPEKRWQRLLGSRRAAPEPTPLAAAARGAPEEVADDGRGHGHAGAEPTRLRPSVSWHIPTLAMPSRWVGVGLAACLVLAAFVIGSGVLWPARSPARTDDAVAATLVRGQDSTALVAGTELSRGDEIRVAAGGRAYLNLGSSYVRMDGGADIRLDSLDPADVNIAQLAGRVYHRVVLPDGGRYRVATGDVTWQATGTAFDIDRETTGSGEQVLTMALQHDVSVNAPGYYGAVPQGSSAVFVLNSTGSAVGEPVTSTIAAALLANGWLVENAQLDARLGLPLGELAKAVLATPTPTPTATLTPQATTPAPTDTPAPTEAATTTPSPTATRTATPKPMPTRTPRPGIPSLGSLSIVSNTNGTYTFKWPRYTGSGFQWYKLVYGPWGTQPTFNGSNYWACNSGLADTSWTGGVAPGDYAVRLQVIDESSGKVVVRAQTPVVRLTVAVPATVNLGNLTVKDNGGGTYTFSWNGYDAIPFDYYKLVYEPYPGNPSYPGGSSYWAVPDPRSTSVTVDLGAGGFVPGDWSVRIQAIGYPGGHSYAYAQTNVYHLYIAPAATPTPVPTPTPTPIPTPTATPS